MTQKYIFIDSCIYIDCCILQKINNHSQDVLNDILYILNTNQAKLFLPEVVSMEFKNAMETKIDKLAEKVKTFQENYLKSKPFNNELMTKQISEHVNTLLQQRKDNKTICEKLVLEIFNNINTIPVKLSSDMILNVVQNFIVDNRQEEEDPTPKLQNTKNEKEPKKHLISYDKLIIESLKSKEELNLKNKYNLLFCTDNIKDFLPFNNSGTVTLSDQKYNIPEYIVKSFSTQISFFDEIKDLLNKNFNKSYPIENTEIQEPTPSIPSTNLSPSPSPEIPDDVEPIQDLVNIKGENNLGTTTTTL